MRKLYWVVIALMLVAAIFLVFKNKAIKESQKEAERVEQKKKKQNAISITEQLASRYNADGNWKKSLRGRDMFTFELEKLWLTEHPILFVGYIQDIATHDEKFYTISIGATQFSTSDYLELSLKSPKDKIDLLLKEHPDLFEMTFDNNVAAIAQVHRIKSSERTETDGSWISMEKVMTGEGELLDILYVGDVSFWWER